MIISEIERSENDNVSEISSSDLSKVLEMLRSRYGLNMATYDFDPEDPDRFYVELY